MRECNPRDGLYANDVHDVPYRLLLTAFQNRSIIGWGGTGRGEGEGRVGSAAQSFNKCK